MKRFTSLFILSGPLLIASADAATFLHAYLDGSNDVHVITRTHRDIRLTVGGGNSAVRVTPDHQTVTWLAKTPGATDVPHKLIIRRQNASHAIHCEPMIRAYWFWSGGTQVALDCGGAHFAGREILYDLRTLTELARIDQATVPFERRPAWSRQGG